MVSPALQKSYFAAKAAQREEKLVWGVFGFTKKGTLCKAPSCKLQTEAEAIKRASAMEGWNPGCKFTVKHI